MRNWAEIVSGRDLEKIARATAEWRTEKGFDTSWRNLSEKLMLVMTEVSEAGEEAEKASGLADSLMFPGTGWKELQTEFIGVVQSYCEEWVDAMVRILDIVGSLGLEVPGCFIGSELNDLFSTVMDDDTMGGIEESTWFAAMGPANASATIFVLRSMSQAMEEYRDVILQKGLEIPVDEQRREKSQAIGACMSRALQACIVAIQIVGEDWAVHYQKKMEKNEQRPPRHGRQR